MSKDEPRVVHLVPALFGPDGVVGGAERYALELAKAMAREISTTLVTFGADDRATRDGTLDIHVIGHPHYVRGQSSNPVSTRMFGQLRAATLVHCHQQHVLASSLAAAYCRLTRRRVYVTDLGGGGWDISAYLSTNRWYHGHLHISQYSRRVFGQEHDPGAQVIYGGVDTEKFSPRPETRRAGYALYVGRLLPHKGVNYLIEALPENMELVVIGKGYDDRYLQDLQRLATGKRVVFRHDADDAALVCAYRQACCIVLPSVYRTLYGQETLVPELLGQTLLEGMACGTPALCTSVASLPEVVDEAVTGFLVPPNDARTLREKLLWLRDHPAAVDEMGTAARARVLELFTWPAVVKRCMEAYGYRRTDGTVDRRHQAK